MNFDFSMSGWRGAAAGLNSADDWTRWAERPWLPANGDVTPLTEMPAMLRRRLNELGRSAARVADAGTPGDASVPVVMASRYGDAVRSLASIRGFADTGEVSPTDFTLSVHSAIGAVCSIARCDQNNYIAVAGGAASAAAGLVEAMGLLAEGAPEVLLVCYDTALPEPYDRFHTEPAALYAWAWRVTRPRAGLPHLRLSLSAADHTDHADGGDGGDGAIPLLPFGLDVMRFAISADARMQRAVDDVTYTWTRHGA